MIKYSGGYIHAIDPYPDDGISDDEIASVLQQVNNNTEYIQYQYGSGNDIRKIRTSAVCVISYQTYEEADSVDYTCEPFINPDCPACP